MKQELASSTSGRALPKAAVERLNTACPYFTMFPLSFPMGRLASARKTDRVLDPFCGRGTTLFAARLRGTQSVGIDSSPVAAAITSSKVAKASMQEVEALAVKLFDTAPEPSDIPEGEYWDWAFHPHTLREVCRLREQLLTLPSNDGAADILRGLALGILHGPKAKGDPTYFSNQMPRTYATKPGAAVSYWRKNDQRPTYVNVRSTLLRRVHYTLAAVPPATVAKVYLGDAATVLGELEDTFDWVVTSPPYYRMYTYIPDQWLRNWFVGGPPTVDYSVSSQISHSSESDFVADLGEVWKCAASRCNPGAHLAVRFGALPSIRATTPEELLRQSLAGSGWRVTRVRDAGQPTARARQAGHMGKQAGTYATEVDLLAILK